MLKFKLSKEEHSKLDDAQKALYSANGESFQLQVEGAVDKSKVDEFRTNNITLQSSLDKFKGIDMEKYSALIKAENDNRDKKLLDAGEFDTLIAEKTAAITSDFTAKLEALTGNYDKLNSENTALKVKHNIDNAAHSAFSSSKIRPEAQQAIMAQIRSTFSVDGDNVVGKNGDKILTGKQGNLTIAEFVESQPEFMKVSSAGGNGQGSNNNSNQSDPMAARRSAYENKFG